MEGMSIQDFLEASRTPMHEIEPNLYLGSLDAAENEKLLKSSGIKYVVQALERPSTYRFDNLTYYYVQIDDLARENMMQHLPGALNFIHSNLQRGDKVLVHCAAGVSRSATIVIAYIMAKYNIPFEEAYAIVRSKRGCVFPNDGFRRQLRSAGPEELRKFL
ncbi:unnamed protein product [Blepharisma stoltei]|uniref:protein-tyrosine-phosphatase n=1 Tax=Blepharisma stoltei TaxID=1481888 RepID=A0AAU9IGI2_9CILI|nr:unnamed protein product [Blepharisma stoltei]